MTSIGSEILFEVADDDLGLRLQQLNGGTASNREILMIMTTRRREKRETTKIVKKPTILPANFLRLESDLFSYIVVIGYSADYPASMERNKLLTS